MYSDLKKVYERYWETYNKSLNSVYPAKKTLGIVEMNQTVKFLFAMAEVAKEKGYSDDVTFWNEFQTLNKANNKNDNHIDGFFLDEKHKEIFLIESKRLYPSRGEGSCGTKITSLTEDSKRAQETITKNWIDWKSNIAKFDPPYKFYIILLADVWPDEKGGREIAFEQWMKKSIFDTSDWVGGPGEFIPEPADLKPISALGQRYFLLCYCWEMGEKTVADLAYNRPSVEAKSDAKPSARIKEPFVDPLTKSIIEVLSKDNDIINTSGSGKNSYVYFMPKRLASCLISPNRYKGNPYCFWVDIKHQSKTVQISFSGQRKNYPTGLRVTVNNQSNWVNNQSENYPSILDSRTEIPVPASFDTDTISAFEKDLENELKIVDGIDIK